MADEKSNKAPESTQSNNTLKSERSDASAKDADRDVRQVSVKPEVVKGEEVQQGTETKREEPNQSDRARMEAEKLAERRAREDQENKERQARQKEAASAPSAEKEGSRAEKKEAEREEAISHPVEHSAGSDAHSRQERALEEVEAAIEGLEGDLQEHNNQVAALHSKAAEHQQSFQAKEQQLNALRQVASVLKESLKVSKKDK